MAADQEPQNIYDDPSFFSGYSKLERFGSGWTKAMEHSQFMGLLPDLAGKRVLDLGCGVGQLAFYLAEAGAAEVVGVDVSEKMLELARSERTHPRVTYVREAIEGVTFPPERFELVVSSLAFHYVEDYQGLVRRVGEWLTPGGVLVYSTEHPVYTARDPADGWVVDADGKRMHWALDDYAEEGARDQRWFVDGVRKYHRTRLAVERVLEPVPDVDTLRRRPEYVDERRRPPFLLVRARRG
jgi:SAM-dependent methyltransferase